MLPAALAQPLFRTYLAGNFVGLNGMWVLRMSMGWLAWDLSGSAAVTGTVAFLNFAPTVVSGPFFGVLADRLDPRRGMMITQAIQAMIAATLLALVATGSATVPVLMAVSLAVGLAASAYHPMRMSLAPRLVPVEHLSQAVAMTAVNFNVSRMLGPAMGGWLLATQGAEAAIAVGGLLFLPQIAVFFSLPAFPPKPRKSVADGGESFLTELSQGAHYVFDNPHVRHAILLTACFVLPARGMLELLPVAADGLYDQGAGGFGALTAVAGGGAVLSAIWMARGAPTPLLLERRAVRATCAGLAMVAVLGLVHSWFAALASVAALGAFGTMAGVSTQTIIQVLTPDGRRGRVMSLWLLVAIGGTALGAVGIGALADWIGLRAAVISTTLASCIPLAWMLLHRPDYRGVNPLR